MALTNTSSKRVSIFQQRDVLKASSIRLKAERARDKEFDEEESRQKHDEALEESVNEHYKALKTVSLKTKSELVVITIIYFVTLH